jgi:hypothetical protein
MCDHVPGASHESDASREFHGLEKMQRFVVAGMTNTASEVVRGEVTLRECMLEPYMHLDDGTITASNPFLALVRAACDILYTGHAIMFFLAAPFVGTEGDGEGEWTCLPWGSDHAYGSGYVRSSDQLSDYLLAEQDERLEEMLQSAAEELGYVANLAIGGAADRVGDNRAKFRADHTVRWYSGLADVTFA